MATPPEVLELIDALAADIYRGTSSFGTVKEQRAMVTADYMARHLIRNGWRKTGTELLPDCPHRTPTCFDPEPHQDCWEEIYRRHAVPRLIP